MCSPRNLKSVSCSTSTILMLRLEGCWCRPGPMFCPPCFNVHIFIKPAEQSPGLYGGNYSISCHEEGLWMFVLLSVDAIMQPTHGHISVSLQVDIHSSDFSGQVKSSTYQQQSIISIITVSMHQLLMYMHIPSSRLTGFWCAVWPRLHFLLAPRLGLGFFIFLFFAARFLLLL